MKSKEILEQDGPDITTQFTNQIQPGIFWRMLTISWHGENISSQERRQNMKNLEPLFIAQLKPSLNGQKEFDCLILLKNGIN